MDNKDVKNYPTDNPNQELIQLQDKYDPQEDYPSQDEIISNQNSNNIPPENYYPPPISNDSYPQNLPPNNIYPNPPPPQTPYIQPNTAVSIPVSAVPPPPPPQNAQPQVVYMQAPPAFKIQPVDFIEQERERQRERERKEEERRQIQQEEECKDCLKILCCCIICFFYLLSGAN